MLIASSVVTIGSSLISKKRTQRSKSLEDKLTKQITVELEKHELEGLDSGAATSMTAQDWADIRQTVREKVVKRQGSSPA